MKRILVIRSDITTMQVDAIVNAANSSLMGGGGVDGAIHRAGGPQILDACRRIVEEQGPCTTGDAVITTAGLLPAKFVIHTVGPVWRGGHFRESQLLSSCYRNALQVAARHECRSVAFPNISTGAYGFPRPDAARISVAAVQEFLSRNELPRQVWFVCFDEENFEWVRHHLEK